VEVAPVPDRRPPKDARFLADHDGTVERETVSRLAGSYDRTLAVPSAGAAVDPPPPAGAEAGTGEEAARREREGAEARIARARAALRPDGGEVAAAPSPSVSEAPGSGGDVRPGRPGGAGTSGAVDARLRPALGALERIAGGPAPVAASGIAEGAGTYLNTRRYRYASYFARIQRAIEQRWDPERAYALHDPNHALHAYRVRVTTLRFVLDGEGHVKQVDVLKSSGVDFLDAEAVRAVRAAAPFPNPPPALAAEGDIDFGAFSFDYGPGRMRDALGASGGEQGGARDQTSVQ
jgi:TonB family protein